MHKTVAWDEFDEGQVAMGRRTILNLGQRRLGKPTAKVEAEFAKIEEPDRLERMIDGILNVKSWRELLAIK